MLKRVAKGAAWMTAPRLMFAAKNPRKAAVLKAVDWATNLVTPRRRRRSTRKLALQGLGAAAVALPLGLWVGRKMRGNGYEHAMDHRGEAHRGEAAGRP